MLQGREVVLGVTGGIAVYKSAEVVSRLRKLGASVHVIMTKNATEFVAPLPFETMSNHPEVTDTFARPATWEVEHISLAQRAEVFVIAPATANIIAKMGKEEPIALESVAKICAVFNCSVDDILELDLNSIDYKKENQDG